MTPKYLPGLLVNKGVYGKSFSYTEKEAELKGLSNVLKPGPVSATVKDFVIP